MQQMPAQPARRKQKCPSQGLNTNKDPAFLFLLFQSGDLLIARKNGIKINTFFFRRRKKRSNTASQPHNKLVRSPYQTCAEMLSLLRTHTEQLKWTSKRKKLMGKAVGKRMRGECPVAGAGAPGSGAPRILFLTAFTIGFLRFEVHFSCPAWVLRRDNMSAHVWYGLRINLL